VLKEQGKSRTLQVMMPGAPAVARKGVLAVPLVGRVAAGQPLEAVENVEDYLALSKSLVGDEDVFLLRVKGDSMVGDGIADSDLLLVRKQSTAEQGDVVVALVGEEATVKRFNRRNGAVVLQPSNPAYQPIVTEPEKVQILGKVLMCLHRL